MGSIVADIVAKSFAVNNDFRNKAHIVCDVGTLYNLLNDQTLPASFPYLSQPGRPQLDDPVWD